MVPQGPSGSAAQGRIVYVVLAHRLPDQVVRLVQVLLSDPHSSVVLHYDGTAPTIDDERVTALPHRPVAWGGASIPALFLDGMRAALEVPGASWITFLSGQDYPLLRPPADIRRDLCSSAFDVHADSHRVEEGNPWPLWEPLTRYGYRYTYTPPLPARVRRYLWRLINRSCALVQRRADAAPEKQPWSVLPRLALRNVGPQLALGRRRKDNPFAATGALHAGDAWFSLRAAAATHVLATLADNPSYAAYMSRTLVPDEAYFQSLFATLLPGLKVGPWRRYRVFRPGESHPAVWRLSELPDVLATGADFARKFDSTVDSSVLDELDRLIGRQVG